MTNKQLCSEVYAVVSALGDNYVSRIPQDFWKTIVSGIDESAIPKIDKTKTIDEQGLSRETLAMLAMLKLKYCCDTEQEKAEYLAKLQKNEDEIMVTLSQATGTRELMKLLKKQ